MSEIPVNPGIDRLLRIIREELDPDGNPDQERGREARGKGLACDMEEQTKSRLSQILGEHTRPGLFMLSAGQLRTLDRLEVSAGAKELVRSLCGLATDHSRYAENQRLETIMTVPATPEGDRGHTEWGEWWLETRGRNLGIHRQEDGQGAETSLLNEMVRAMGSQAMPHIPSYRDIARAVKGRGEKPRLSQVFIQAYGILKTASRMLSPHGARHETGPGRASPGDTPEDVARHLTEWGIEFLGDMGTAGTDLVRLKRNLGGRKTHEIRLRTLENGRSVWYPEDAQDTHHLPAAIQPYLQEECDPGLSRLPEAEEMLVRETDPGHPKAHHHRERDVQAGHIGWIAGNTPENVARFLNGEERTPVPPPPAEETEVCPKAEICPTWCGRLQRTQEAAHPVNDDWSHHSCGYWRFLRLNRNAQGNIREAAAEREVKRLWKERNENWKRRTGQAPDQGGVSAPERPPVIRGRRRNGNGAEGPAEEKNPQTQQALF